MPYALGIDVGTSFTAAATSRAVGVVEVVALGPVADSIPTIVYLTDAGDLLIGDAAARRLVIDPRGAASEFKRRMGDPTPIILRRSPFSAESLLRHMIEQVVRRVEEREGELPTGIVLTHPANWGPYKLDLLDQAIQAADLGVPVSKLTEPEAVAVAYGSRTEVPIGAVIGVYDLGGGTFDAAILRREAGGFRLLGDSVGVEHLGGVEFDEAVLNHVRDHLGTRWPSDGDDPALLAPMAQLRRSCVQAKELLSVTRSVTIPVLLPGVETAVELGRDLFESMIGPRIDDTVTALEAALSSAGLTKDDLHAIVLAGGSSRIPLVSATVVRRLGRPLATDIDPLFAVAIGAASEAARRTLTAEVRPAAAPLRPESAPVSDRTATFIEATPAPRPRRGKPAWLVPVALAAAAGLLIGFGVDRAARDSGPTVAAGETTAPTSPVPQTAATPAPTTAAPSTVPVDSRPADDSPSSGPGALRQIKGVIPGSFERASIADALMYQTHAYDATILAVLAAVADRADGGSQLARSIWRSAGGSAGTTNDVAASCNAIGAEPLGPGPTTADCVRQAIDAPNNPEFDLNIDGLTSALGFDSRGMALAAPFSFAEFEEDGAVSAIRPAPAFHPAGDLTEPVWPDSRTIPGGSLRVGLLVNATAATLAEPLIVGAGRAFDDLAAAFSANGIPCTDGASRSCTIDDGARGTFEIELAEVRACYGTTTRLPEQCPADQLLTTVDDGWSRLRNENVDVIVGPVTTSDLKALDVTSAIDGAPGYVGVQVPLLTPSATGEDVVNDANLGWVFQLATDSLQADAMWGIIESNFALSAGGSIEVVHLDTGYGPSLLRALEQRANGTIAVNSYPYSNEQSLPTCWHALGVQIGSAIKELPGTGPVIVVGLENDAPGILRGLIDAGVEPSRILGATGVMKKAVGEKYLTVDTSCTQE